MDVVLNSMDDHNFNKGEDDFVEDVAYGLDNIQSEDLERNYWAEERRQLPSAVRDLRQLSQLTKAEMIYIYIIGGGVSDGSDLTSQLKIREICQVVKRLLNLFGERLKVWKVERFNVSKVRVTGPPTSRDVTNYWTAPTADVKIRVVESQATFRDIMQVQIADCTGRGPFFDYFAQMRTIRFTSRRDGVHGSTGTVGIRQI